MKLKVFPDKSSLAASAAEDAAAILREAIRKQGRARVTAATGTSQIEFLDKLTGASGIDWRRLELFHLDEYLGLECSHPASFRKYLLERLIHKVGITHYHLINGDHDPGKAIAELTIQIRKAPVDLTFVGIGENGHIAFNDPPADFVTQESYIVVELDEASRRQQFEGGWFASLNEVPRRAISMTVQQILKSKKILCIAPEARKAAAVARCFQGEVSPLAPASILRTHPDAILYLDKESARELNPELVRSGNA